MPSNSMKEQLAPIKKKLSGGGGLILNRDIGDTLHLGEGEDEIIITVMPTTRRSKTSLRIQAPKHIKIDRGENRRRS